MSQNVDGSSHKIKMPSQLWFLLRDRVESGYFTEMHRFLQMNNLEETHRDNDEDDNDCVMELGSGTPEP